MPLTPDQERQLDAVAATLVVTDPALARALTGARPWRPHPVLTVALGLGVVLLTLAVGLVPLAIGVSRDVPWLAGIGAVTTCSLPFVALWVTTRVFPRLTAWVRSLG